MFEFLLISKRLNCREDSVSFQQRIDSRKMDRTRVQQYSWNYHYDNIVFLFKYIIGPDSQSFFWDQLV